MSTRYEAFLPEVLPFAPECPETVAVNAIRNACIEFCQKSLYWLYDHDPLTVMAGVSTYTLEVPDYTTPAVVTDAWYDNLVLEPRGADELRKGYAYDWRSMEGSPQFFTQELPGEVILVPTPLVTLTSGLNMIVALKPTRDSVDIDDNIYENWAEGISYGARSKLLALPGQTFSDPSSAAAYAALFTNAIGQAKIARNRGLARAVQRVRPPEFF